MILSEEAARICYGILNGRVPSVCCCSSPLLLKFNLYYLIGFLSSYPTGSTARFDCRLALLGQFCSRLRPALVILTNQDYKVEAVVAGLGLRP